MSHNQVLLGKFPCAITEVTTITFVIEPPDWYQIQSDIRNMAHFFQCHSATRWCQQTYLLYTNNPTWTIVSHLHVAVISSRVWWEVFSLRGQVKWRTGINHHVYSSPTRFTLFCSLMNNCSSSLVAMVEVFLLSRIFFGSTPSTPLLSFLQFFWKCPDFPQ